MFKFMEVSFPSRTTFLTLQWSFKNHEQLKPPATLTSLDRLSSWLVNTRLFEEVWSFHIIFVQSFNLHAGLDYRMLSRQ